MLSSLTVLERKWTEKWSRSNKYLCGEVTPNGVRCISISSRRWRFAVFEGSLVMLRSLVSTPRESRISVQPTEVTGRADSQPRKVLIGLFSFQANRKSHKTHTSAAQARSASVALWYFWGTHMHNWPYRQNVHLRESHKIFTSLGVHFMIMAKWS